jgi:GNAT superfamily N-acetyltransferase
MSDQDSFEVRPLGPETWEDFAELFSQSGSGCWCMWPRMPVGAMWTREEGENRRDMERLVTGGEVTGLLGYVGGRPTAWVSISPRGSLARLRPSAGDEPWVIACMYLSTFVRGKGFAKQLIASAVEYAAQRGAGTIEAIPWGWRTDEGDSGKGRLVQMLRDAGFDEVDPESEGVSFRMAVQTLR